MGAVGEECNPVVPGPVYWICPLPDAARRVVPLSFTHDTL
jgi:hypothetical protein